MQNLVIIISMSLCTALAHLAAAPVKLHDEPPVSVNLLVDGVVLIDFGRVSFGNIRLNPPVGATGEATVHFGEAFTESRINRKPPGSVRYKKVKIKFQGEKFIIVEPSADRRNTMTAHRNNPPAILTPEEWGVVLPFRWVEIEGWPGEFKAEQITRQSAWSSTWNDDAADFESSDDTLNRIWDLCKYSIKATTFAGVYVDGDRERIPYEADAYLNQLSHYYTDSDIEMARDTYDHLMKNETWPTEWASHMIFMAHADWMQTADVKWLKPRYEALKKKLLTHRKDEKGLIISRPKDIKRTDIVDWPKLERDGHVFERYNTVVNAFHLQTLAQMSDLAAALGKTAEAQVFKQEYQSVSEVFQQTFYNTESNIYRDGSETDHSSQHSNLFPLAFGLVPSGKQAGVTEWTADRGMKCSVYAAQYLLEGLFEHGEDKKAMDLILADNDRSWKHMVNSGATITWEAWDQKYKPNQDWNHAWGAAPANILPRYVLGVEAHTAGWKQIQIRPYISGLSYAKGKVPTPHGSVHVHWVLADTFKLSVTTPENIPAHIDLPFVKGSTTVKVNGKPVKAKRKAKRWILTQPITGTAHIEVL